MSMSVWNKFFIISGIWLIGSASVIHGQTIPPEPSVCTTPPSGYLKGGRIGFDNTFFCMQASDNTIDVKINNNNDPALGSTLASPKFYFGIDNTFDINSPTGLLTTVGNSAIAKATEGVYWVLLEGTKNGQKYLSCKYTEVGKRSAPDVSVSNCTGNQYSVTINATNKQDFFTINWPDGSVEKVDARTTPLPITKTKAITSGTGVPEVQAAYYRFSNETCQSAFFRPVLDASDSPFIHTLIGENEGKSADIQFNRIVVGKTYDILGRVDNGNTSEPWIKLGEGLNGKATLTGLDPNLRYCFKTRTKNSCNNDVYSENTICSIKINADIKSSSEAEVRWNLPTEPNAIPSKLRLYKDVEGCNTCQELPPLPNNYTTKYDAKNLVCAKTYLFIVQATYPAVIIEGTPTPIVVKSAQIKVNPKTNAVAKKPNDLVFVGFDPSDDQKVQIRIVDNSNPSDQFKYTFYRAENESTNFQKLGERTESSFDDVAISPDPKSYCYKYTVEDNCGVTSLMSDPFCTILLGSKTQGSLNWSPFLTPPDVYNSASPVDYSIEYFDEDFNAYILYQTTASLQESVQKLLSESETSEVKFRVMGQQMVDTDLYTNQRIFSYSNTFIIKVLPGMYIPTAFTPNGEGPAESETFKINSKFVSEGNIKIFDRWGGTIFEGNALTGEWDGTEANGITPAPAGNYLYVINAVSDTGLAFTMKGTVLLLR